MVVIRYVIGTEFIKTIKQQVYLTSLLKSL